MRIIPNDSIIEGVWLPATHPDEDLDGGRVGHEGVTKITYREQNFGTYGIGWFDIYEGGEHPVRSFNAMYVADVMYALKQKENSP